MASKSELEQALGAYRALTKLGKTSAERAHYRQEAEATERELAHLLGAEVEPLRRRYARGAKARADDHA